MNNRIAGVEAAAELAAVPRLAHVPPALRRLIFQEGYVPAADADRLLLAECVYPTPLGLGASSGAVAPAGSALSDVEGLVSDSLAGPTASKSALTIAAAAAGEADDEFLQILLTRSPLLRDGIPRVGLLINCANPVQRSLIATRLQQRLQSLLLLDGGVIRRYAPMAGGGCVALITAPWALRVAIRRATECLLHLDPLLNVPAWHGDAQVLGQQQLEHDAAALSTLMHQAGGLDRHLSGARHLVWRFSSLTSRDCVLPGRGVLWAVYLDDAAVDLVRLRLQLFQLALERVQHLGEVHLRWVSTLAGTQRAETAAKPKFPVQRAGAGAEPDGGRHFQEVEARAHALPPWGLRLVVRASWNGPKTRRAFACVLAELLGITADRIDASAADAVVEVVSEPCPAEAEAQVGRIGTARTTSGNDIEAGRGRSVK